MTYNEKGFYDSPSAPPPPPPPHQYNNDINKEGGVRGYQPPPQNHYTSPPHSYPPSPFQNYNHNEPKKSFDDPNLYHQIPIMGGYHNPRESMSNMNLTSHKNIYDSDDEDEENALKRGHMIPKEKRKRSCMDKLCCGCCTCCPKWVRYCSCIIFLLIIAAGIVIGVLAALFKVPQVHMSGLEGTPNVTVNGMQINMGFQLAISVNNPNVEGITFDSIVAKAYYPKHHDVQLGGGEKDQVVIAKQQTTNFTFPFDLTIDIGNPTYQSIVNDLFEKCGLLGSPKQQLTIDYDVIPTVKFGIIPISVTISNSASFDCPDVLQNLNSIASAAGGVSNSLGSSTITTT
ncbi:unnamed protein product [Cunninghamella blakesleeana]